MMNNPFDITKAVDYTDAEIYKYWVDLSGGNQGFEEGVIKPNTVMPMIIVGSKGSGKTHIMKYFSYELQKIRCIAQNNSMQEGLAKEKFIGVYIRCSGFNSDKFTGKGVDNEVWSLLHAYFWELWVGERLVNILIDLRNNGLLEESSESDLVADILHLFLKCEEEITTFEGLNEYLLSLQKNVDYQVHNFIFWGQDKPMVDILLPPTRLTYEIPTLLKTKVPFFKDKYILYLIDELENFSAEQQQLIQTLIREKPAACTFRVGTRPYGIRTLKTLRGVEENHDGAEFEGVILDEFLRSYQHYPEYITKILENRLQNSGLSLLRGCKLEDLFEVQNNEDILRLVGKKKESQSRSYMQTLKKKLERAHLKEDVIDEIIINITYADDLLIERTSVMLMYRAMKVQAKEIWLEASRHIAESAQSYAQFKNRESMHNTILEKYKQDIIDNMAREGRVNIPYNGLNKLIELSCGTPRTILCLLKAAFNNQYFNTGQMPFEDGRKLNIKAQQVGIESTYEWFYEENRIPSFKYGKATDAVMRVGDYLRKIRFSDLPPQCSINIFTLNASELSPEAREVFEALLSYSYIIQTDERRQINSDNKTHVYRLNTILCPKFELALSKRGAINFSAAEAELFFNLDKSDEYETFVTNKLKGYNYPFGLKMEKTQTLF